MKKVKKQFDLDVDTIARLKAIAKSKGHRTLKPFIEWMLENYSKGIKI